MYKHYGVDFQIRSDDKRVHNIVTKKEVTTEAETHIISAEERGQIELEGYVMNRLGEKAKISVWSPIKRWNLKMFSTPLKKSKNKSQVESLIWGAAYKTLVLRENPVEYGWIMSSNNMYKPVLTLDAIAPESVLKISKCKCETGCKVKYNRCSCVKRGVSCDVQCECSETCENTDSELGQ